MKKTQLTEEKDQKIQNITRLLAQLLFQWYKRQFKEDTIDKLSINSVKGGDKNG